MVERIHSALTFPWARLELRADGHKLAAEVRRVSHRSMTYRVALFVDGFIDGKNLDKESEIGAKFYPLRSRQLLPKREFDAYQKAFGKRKALAFKARARYQYRDPFFVSGRALAMHLKKTCTVVEIVEPAAIGPEEA